MAPRSTINRDSLSRLSDRNLLPAACRMAWWNCRLWRASVCGAAPSAISATSASQIDPITCRWDFSSVNQLYCNGGCTWSGGSDCDQTEADIFCKLKMDNPNSTAISWTSTTALPEHGFPCTWNGDALNIVNRGVSMTVKYQESSILGNHGPGNVIAYPVCTDP